MEKPLPIWQDLPRHLKIYIAEKLGDKSRSSLAQCSKSDLEIVQAIPFNLKSITIGSTDIITAVYHVEIQKYQSATMIVEAETAINIFLNFFKNPKSIADSVIFNISRDTFFSDFASALKSQKIKIRSKKVCLNRTANYMEVNKNYLEILKIFNEKILEVIEIIPIVTDEILQNLVRTEQWKNIEGVVLLVEEGANIDLKDFFHLKMIFLRGSNVWNNGNKEKLIENFQKQDFPINSFFFLSDSTGFNRMAMEDAPIEEEYDMPTSENKLHVKILPRKIQGRVISKSLGDDNLTIDKLLYRLFS